MSSQGSVQDGYLKEAAAKETPIRISLLNDKEVRGVVEGFDAFTVLLSTKRSKILVYKSAIVAIGTAADKKNNKNEPEDGG